MALPALAAVALLTKDAVLVIKNVNDDALKREEAALRAGPQDARRRERLGARFRRRFGTKPSGTSVLSKRPWIGSRSISGPNALSDKAAQKFVILEPDGKITFASDSRRAARRDAGAEILAATAP